MSNRLARARAAFPELAVWTETRVRPLVADAATVPVEHWIDPQWTLQRRLAEAIHLAGRMVAPQWPLSPALVTLDHLRQQPEKEFHWFNELASANGPRSLKMELESMTTDSRVVGCKALVPWTRDDKGRKAFPWAGKGQAGEHMQDEDEEEDEDEDDDAFNQHTPSFVPCMPVLAVHIALLGIASPRSSTRNRSFTMRYARPLTGTHRLTPLNGVIRENASTNTAIGEFSVWTTLGLLRSGMRNKAMTLSGGERASSRSIYMAKLPVPIRQDQLLHDYPWLTKRESPQGSVVCRSPKYSHMPLLVFRQQIALLGAQDAKAMHEVLYDLLPLVLEAEEVQETKKRTRMEEPTGSVSSVKRQRKE